MHAPFPHKRVALGLGGKVLRRALVAALAITGALMPIAVGGSAAAIQRSTPPAEAAKNIASHGCGKHLQCANVRVPLDWEHLHGRKIKLAVIRYLASRPGQRIGSLFINPGGPGASGVAAVRGGGKALDSLVQGRFDIVSWDIRGSGQSAC